jgi:hypothetical protein
LVVSHGLYKGYQWFKKDFLIEKDKKEGEV